MIPVPEDHIGSDGTDVTQVLHMGRTDAGLTIGHHHGLVGRSISHEATLYAFSLPNGKPGRPFIRFAGGDDQEAPYFDEHGVEELRQVMDAHVAALATLGKYTREMQAWDRSATATEQAWDQAARRHRPCQGSAGEAENCPLCAPEGATPGELFGLELMQLMGNYTPSSEVRAG